MNQTQISQHALSSTSKNDLNTNYPIAPPMQDALINEPTSYAAQQFLKECYDDHKWLSCACAESAYLAIRKTTNFYCLVRLTRRGDHREDCAFSEDNMPIYRKKLAQMITTNALTFHQNRPTSKPTNIKSPIAITGLQAEATKLARFMFTLYQESSLNTVPLSGVHPEISQQYKSIRSTAERYYIAGKSGSKIIFTHPGAIETAKAYLYENKWDDNQVPQVLLFFTVDEIAGRTLNMRIAGEEYSLTCQSKVEYFFDNASPPYNCLMTMALRPDSPEPEVLRCVAIPVLNKAWLLPVKNHLVRHFIKSMLASSGEIKTHGTSLAIPFFPQYFRDVMIRPDFSVERDGRSLVVIYFLSHHDEGFDARNAEVHFLKSVGVEVYVFDMDKERENPTRDAWKAARFFVDRYVKPIDIEPAKLTEDA